MSSEVQYVRVTEKSIFADDRWFPVVMCVEHRHAARWGIEIDINWIRLSSSAGWVLVMCAGGSGVNANCPSGRTTLSPTYRDISKISRFSYHLCEHWVFVAEVDAGKTIENGVVMRRQQRITHTANCCEIWAKVSEIEWQNIWGQSCCFLAQFNMWNVNFSLLSRSSSKGRFDIVSYSILIFFPLSLILCRFRHVDHKTLACHPIHFNASQ